jgi:hypothetical protein
MNSKLWKTFATICLSVVVSVIFIMHIILCNTDGIHWQLEHWHGNPNLFSFGTMEKEKIVQLENGIMTCCFPCIHDLSYGYSLKNGQ